MAYIDFDYYSNRFGGTQVTGKEFDRLADIATDVIDSILQQSVNLSELESDAAECVKKATAYQVEMLYHNGGVDALVGMGALAAQSESLGDYRISGRSGLSAEAESSVPTHNGIPISPLLDGLLRRAGLMSRWAYSGFTYDELRKGGVYG